MATQRRAARQSDAPEVVYGVHRSLALAERHVLELNRKRPPANWFIAARRRVDGAFSERGHHFTFQREAKPPPPPLFEWLVSFTYERTGRTFDIIVSAPTEEQALSEAKGFLRKDRNGIKVLASLNAWKVAPVRGPQVDEYQPPEYRDESEETESEENAEESV